MTGIFIRLNGKSVEFDQLTDEQMREFIATQNPDEGWGWAMSLARWIRDNVKTEEPSR